MGRKSINIVAGKEAYNLIKKEGFSTDLIKGVSAAAGGPKWFTTYGLTRYIISDLIPSDGKKRHFIGSSVGAWQMTAAVSNSPSQTLERLRKAYSEHIYSDEPDEKEIADACRSIISHMLNDVASEVISSPHKKLHVITARAKGTLGHKNKIVLGASLGLAAIAHSIKRSWINPFLQRTILSNTDILPFDNSIDDLITEVHRLTEVNILDSLQASGSIPFLMERRENISGAPDGVYWDGGLTDYHISLPYQFENNGYVLQAHHGPNVLAGWFDKHLPYVRRAKTAHMSKVILVYPTEQFIDSLPLSRISDLKDFDFFGTDQDKRIKYWQEISNRSHEMAEEFQNMIETNTIADHMQAY